MSTSPPALWRNRDFLRLWTGETVSVFGTLIGGLALDFTAIIWLDASPFAVAVLLACQLAPGFIFGMVAGVWVDRLRRRPLMIAADLLRFALLLTVPAAAALDILSVAQLYGVAFAKTTLDTFFDTAYQAYLPTLVGRERVLEGNSKLSATASAAEVAGFGAAGWLVQLLSAPGAILLDAMSFLASAFAIWRIRQQEPPPSPVEDREGFLAEARGGIRAVTGNPVLRALAVTLLLWRLPSAIFGAAFLLFVTRELDIGPGLQGTIYGIGGITSVGGAFLAARSGRLHFGRSMAAAAFMRAAGTFFPALAAGPKPARVGALVANQLCTDPAWTYYEIQEVSLRQAAASDRVLGRVSATMRMVEFGAALTGMLVGGALAEWVGLRPTLLVAAGGMTAAGVYFAASPAARLRRLPLREWAPEPASG